MVPVLLLKGAQMTIGVLFYVGVIVLLVFPSLPALPLSLSIRSHCLLCLYLATSMCECSYILSSCLLSNQCVFPEPAHPPSLVYIVVTFVRCPGCWLPAVLLCDLPAALRRMGQFIRAKDQGQDTLSHTHVHTHTLKHMTNYLLLSCFS